MSYPPNQGYPPQQGYPPVGVPVGVPVGFAPGMVVGYHQGYFVGTITHDCKHDAEVLRKAMKGIGTNESDLIKVLANRNWAEREQIKREFSAKYSKDLIQDIKSETSGNFEKCLVALLTEPAHFDVEQIHSACAGAGTNENTIIEILVTRSNVQMEYIKQIFKNKHGKSLKDRLESEASGDFKKLLEKLTEPRDESPVINPMQVSKDAEDLYKAGEGKIGTDEKEFIKILTSRSLPHIAAVASEYIKHHKKHSLIKAIDSEFSGSIKTGLIAIVTYALNPYGYFAEILNKSMKGAGTNDNKLIRTVVTQMHNMPQIKTAYSTLFKNSLAHDIQADCSGDFKKLLLDIIS